MIIEQDRFFQNNGSFYIIMRQKYTQDSYRFVIVVVYIAAALVNSLPVHTFSSINRLVSEKFDISGIQVTLNALLFTIAHPLFALPCNWLINKYGMRISFVVGATFLIAGVWLRLLLEVGQALYCLFGSCLAAIGNIFILNTPSKVALNWFSKQKVGIVTFTGILATLISITIGASGPSFFIDKNSTTSDIKTFLMIQAILVTIPMLLLVIFFREKPDEPPSKAAMAVTTETRIKYKDLLSKLFKNKQYLKLMMAMTFNYGTLTALIMILDQLLGNLGYPDDGSMSSGKVTSLTVASAMIAGIFSNPIFSYLLRSTKAYRAVAALNTFGGFFMTGLLIFGYIYHINKTVYIILLGALVGFFLIPLPSIMISYSSQIVFPVDQSSSAGYLFASSQTFGFLIGFGSITYLQNTETKSAAQLIGYINIGLLLLSFLAAIWVKQELKKYHFEKTEYEVSRSKTPLEASLIVKDQMLE